MAIHVDIRFWEVLKLLSLCNFSPPSLTPSAQSKDSKTPLHMAATHGRFSCSQALIQNGESAAASVLLLIEVP